jgi:hypothetical protein
MSDFDSASASSRRFTTPDAVPLPLFTFYEHDAERTTDDHATSQSPECIRDSQSVDRHLSTTFPRPSQADKRLTVRLGESLQQMIHDSAIIEGMGIPRTPSMAARRHSSVRSKGTRRHRSYRISHASNLDGYSDGVPLVPPLPVQEDVNSLTEAPEVRDSQLPPPYEKVPSNQKDPLEDEKIFLSGWRLAFAQVG